MQKNKWSRKFDWIQSGSTYYQEDRIEKFNENRFIAVGDIYFKLNKYLTGVTFTYINSLEDIYKRDLLTGDGYSIINMYNEYDVIDRVLKNLVIVDVASNVNIDLNSQWRIIDNVQLMPGHLVLLNNQTSEVENDVYEVNSQYFLINCGLLSTREKSDKFSCSVKMGTNADKQFFLINSGSTFPIIHESKSFIEGKSFIIKNLIKYNLYNTATNSANTSKIIFTDYDFARKQLVKNYELYSDAFVDCSITPSTSYVSIDYHHDLYTIRTGVTTSYTGVTSGITFYSGVTVIPYSAPFEVSVGDYIYLNIYNGSTSLLVLKTFVKSVETNYIILEESLPGSILASLKLYPFSVENLTIGKNWNDAIDKLSNHTPYVDFYSVTVTSGITQSLSLIPNGYKYDKYFDYNGLIFNFKDDSDIKYFFTDNQYIKYNLYERLNQIDSVLFESGFTFFNEYLLTGISYQYTDNNRIRITTSITGLTDIFKPFTYVYADGESLQKTLIYEVDDHDIIIEKPELWSNYPPPIVTSLQNIDGLKNISDILYEVYMNIDYDWYIHKTDNERKYIAKKYAELLTLNSAFRDNVTGILYENDNNEFILKLYDLKNDRNLFYFPIELVFVGIDKKTRIPVPLSMLQTD